MPVEPKRASTRRRHTPDPNARIWRLPAVATYTQKSRSGILRDVAAGTFPRPVRLGEHSVGWLRTEVEAWLAARIAERDGNAA